MSDGSNVHIVYIVSRMLGDCPGPSLADCWKITIAPLRSRKMEERTSEVFFNKESPKRDGRFGLSNDSAGL